MPQVKRVASAELSAPTRVKLPRLQRAHRSQTFHSEPGYHNISSYPYSTTKSEPLRYDQAEPSYEFIMIPPRSSTDERDHLDTRLP
jgi:hypothetical protein